MSIRPMDYQILMPKVNEVAKNQNAEQQKLLGHILQQAESSVKKAKRDTKSVHSQNKAENTIIAEKQKDRNKNKEKQDKKSDDQDEKEAVSKLLRPNHKEKHTIDIRL